MSEYVEIESRDYLARDTYSKGIVNTNYDAYKAAVQRSEEAKKRQEQLNAVTSEINSLKKDMNEIKSLLEKIATKE